MDTLLFTPLKLVTIDAACNVRWRWRIAAYHDLSVQVIIETG